MDEEKYPDSELFENPDAFNDGNDDPSADYEMRSESDEGQVTIEPVSEKNKKPKRKKHPLREWTEALIFAFIGVLFLKTFIFEPFAIPSDSMDNTLLAGDYIVVNKLAYGPRLPMTPLSVPFSHQTIGNSPSYVEWWKIPYVRIPGYSEIKRNDVIVFNFPAEDIFPLNGHAKNYPIDHRTHFIKRCIGLPGDTLEIIDREVFIDGDTLPFPKCVLFNYIVKMDSTKRDSVNLKKLGMMTESRQGRFYFYSLPLLPSQADSLRLLKQIISVEAELSQKGSYS